MSKIFVCSCIIFILFLSSFDGAAIDGIVPLIQENFNITDAKTAVIRTSSSVASTSTLVVVWLFGDIFERRKLFISSVACWIVFSLISVVLGSESFLIFVGLRTMASAASAVFGILTPVMLADLFKDRALGIALMCMTSMEILSSQIIGILNSWIVTSGVPWQSGLLIGPLMSILPLIALLCSRLNFRKVAKNYEIRTVRRSFVNAFGIFSIKSYLLMTVGMALGQFTLRSMLFWIPTMILNAWTAYPDLFLGLSYTTAITLNSLTQIVGTILGLPVFLWFAQSWRHGTGPFSGRAGNAHAYPMVVAFGASTYALMLVISFILISSNFIAYVAATFIAHIAAAADTSLSQQMILMVVPSTSRAAAVALTRLIAGIVATPAAQLTGMVSDAFRGDSTEPSDRFHAYRMALLCSALFAVGNAICDLILIAFFPSDCEKAVERDRKEGDMDENTSLIKPTNPHSESLLDTVIRSRTATLISIY